MNRYQITIKYPSNPFKDEEAIMYLNAKSVSEVNNIMKEILNHNSINQYRLRIKPINNSVIAQELGKQGGNKTVKKYGKTQMKEWGKKGGRPRKLT